jgi:hypothetical protein
MSLGGGDGGMAGQQFLQPHLHQLRAAQYERQVGKIYKNPSKLKKWCKESRG